MRINGTPPLPLHQANSATMANTAKLTTPSPAVREILPEVGAAAADPLAVEEAEDTA